MVQHTRPADYNRGSNCLRGVSRTVAEAVELLKRRNCSESRCGEYGLKRWLRKGDIAMREMAIRLCVGLTVAFVCSLVRADDHRLIVWPVDAHTKVFRDTIPSTTGGGVKLRAARNEYEPAQVAIRVPAPIEGVSVMFSPLKHSEGRATIDGDNLRWSYVGFVPIEQNSRHSERIVIRDAPCEIPDPLLAERTIDLKANSTQPVWLTVRIPKDAPAGVYRGEVAVTASGTRVALPVELRVDPFVLPDDRHLYVTHWFSTERIAKTYGVEPWSEACWQILGRYAQNFAAHRQNVVLTPLSRIAVTRRKDGKLAFDYRDFDRFVELFLREGAMDLIEISHAARHKEGGWSSNEFVLRDVAITDAATGQPVKLPAEEAMPRLLADLEEHLAQQGWLDKAILEIGDEPALHSVESWRAISRQIHRAAPRLRRIEAIETIDFDGVLEVWVPKLSHLDRWRQAYASFRDQNEFWYYLAVHPYGNTNRYLDYPLSSVRTLHWINFAEDLRGYLHYGLMAWAEDPFGPPPKRWPPGDGHITYPGADGPLDSLRWEIQRESIEDFEYLHLLTDKTAELKGRLGTKADWLDPRRRAMELCRRIVPSIPDTELDAARILEARYQAADEILAVQTAPLLLVQTEPPAGSTLLRSHVLIEVRGITEPGASVKVNGSGVDVRDDGTFACRASVRGEKQELRIEIEKEGKTKTAIRRFRLRP